MKKNKDKNLVMCLNNFRLSKKYDHFNRVKKYL